MEESALVNAPVSVLAIDPGKSGAVCRIGRGTFKVLRDFKTLADIASAIRELAAGVDYAVMELVHAMPGQGVCSMFSFGQAAGVAEGALAFCIPDPGRVQQVSPQTWQNFYRNHFQIPKTQEFDSRALATNIFPSFAAYFKRKLDHNSGDAVLMAVWKLLNLS